MNPLNPSVALPQSHAVDSLPLLTPSITDNLLRSRRLLRRPTPLRGAAARFLRRASSRRLMLREPSVRVRENAAEQLEETQSDWAYSKPVIVIDVLWNLAFVVIAVAVLGFTLKEKPNVPLRAWIVGYGLQCFCHVGCVVVEYRRRSNSVLGESRILDSGAGSDGGYALDFRSQQRGNEGQSTSVAKRLESASTTFSIIWWIAGFYWITSGGQNLTKESPQLSWLCIIFLAFDALFVIICVAVACLIGIAICCCLPCIIGILYAMTDQEGATLEEIDQLPKYKFRRIGDVEKVNGETQESFEGMMTECDANTPIERVLSHEDAECCICLSAYEDGNELRQLPCNHHFHLMCIDKWLYINATCPLCKFDIIKTDSQSGREEV